MLLLDILILFLANALIAVSVASMAGRQRFMWLAFIYSIVVSIGGTFSIIDHFQHGGVGTPYLGGSDGEGYFLQANLLMNSNMFDFKRIFSSNYYGFQIYLSLWFRIFGDSLIVALVANSTLLFSALAVLYRATINFTKSTNVAIYSSIAFALTTQHIYASLLILKEPALLLSFGLLTLFFSRVYERRAVNLSDLFPILFSFLIIVTMRGSLAPFFVGALILFALTMPRKNITYFAPLALVAVLVPLAQSFTNHGFSIQWFLETIFGNEIVSNKLATGVVDVSGVVGTVSKFYLNQSFIVKTILFPVPTLLQFFLPFEFWSRDFLDVYPSILFSRNLNVLWYGFVGVWFLFALSRVKTIMNVPIRNLLLLGTAFYIFIAMIYGGAIPRYASPALMFIYPAIGFVWGATNRDYGGRVMARNFFIAYYSALMGGVGLYLLLRFVI